ncbi:MAG TPA: hypothetical protein VE338_02785, partial [Ktedonobacterales bacterium]|nr:hypothetical protein [Ktedonobacterales bacterium]
VTTLEFSAFLLVIYALARAIWSPAVALVSVAILALGPEWALLRELQAGAGAQETLLFGALVIWLAFLRLGVAPGRRALAFDVAFGLAAGLALWSDFLFLPYLAAALLALACLALRDWRIGALGVGRAVSEVALGVIGFGVGAAPFIWANIGSHGQTLRHAVALAQAHNGVAAPGIGERLRLLLGQIGATLLVGLPQTLGSATICPDCAIWPQQGMTVTLGELARELAFAAPFSLLALGLWLWSALPLARDLQRFAPVAAASIFAQRYAQPGRAASVLPVPSALPALDPRWWGRLMLTLGGALTLLQYLISRTSYTFPASSARYLIGLYICAPLVAAPLVAAARVAWRWAALRASAQASLTATFGAPLGVALLLLILLINGAGAAHALAATSDRQTYGQPMGQRDTRLVAFLQSHHSPDFYAGYWTCLRLVFTSEQQVNCAVIDQYDAFKPGFNRYLPAMRRTLANPHPAWVFDVTRGDEAATVPAQVAACVASAAPRCAGYASTMRDGYLIFYYAGQSSP